LVEEGNLEQIDVEGRGTRLALSPRNSGEFGMKLMCLTLAWLLVAAGAQGQDRTSVVSTGGTGTASPVGSAGVFRSEVDLVALTVVVTDARQHFVGGLSAGDFAIFENGVRQDVTHFSAREAPLDLVLLLDTSASMTERLPAVRQAARGLLLTLRRGDRSMVVDVKNTARILSPLGPDIGEAIAAVERTKAGGHTALFNSLYTALKDLDRERRVKRDEVRRQAIVVLSDGVDTSSLVEFDDVMDLAKQSGILIYTITVKPAPAGGASGSAARTIDPADYGMKSLAQETGARAFFPVDTGGLKDAYKAIGADLANQYSLAYVPTSQATDGIFRRVLVSISTRGDVRARTRSGYLPRASHARGNE
jgi:VWFA-related protein